MSVLLIFNRLSGILLWGISFQGNLAIVSCLYVSKITNFTQKTLFLSTFLSLMTDMVMVVALLGWFLDNEWSIFTELVVLMNVLKRFYSIASVSLMFRRFSAFCLKSSKQQPVITYTLGYAVLSIITAFLHFYSYFSNQWVSAATRECDLFKYGYRSMNIIVSIYYFFISTYSNIAFLMLGKNSSFMAEKILRVRRYYNIYIYLSLELLFYLAFFISTVWSFFSADVTAALYIEQCLLTYSTLNAFYAVHSSSGK